MNSKKTLLAAGLIAAGIAGVAGVTASAAAQPGTGSLVEKLATKFNLNKDDVQAVFDQAQDERKAEMQAQQSERLQELVDDSKITAEQKIKIEEKQKELQAQRDTERDELEAWAEQQGIDMRYVMGGPGHDGDDDRLQSLVDDGKITAEQKSAIEAKRDELDTKRQTARDELKKWADDNDISMRYLMFGGRRGHGGGPRGDM